MNKLFLNPIREENRLSVSTLAFIKGGANGAMNPLCTSNSCVQKSAACTGINVCNKHAEPCGDNTCGTNTCDSYSITIKPCSPVT